MFWRKKELNLGKFGEKESEKFLKKKGFKILEKNYQNKKGKKIGEIDIIAKKDGEIVFVEVKTRRESKEKTLPEENINHRKLHSLQRISQIYLKENNLESRPYHFDAVSVLVSHESEIIEIRHLENIFI